MMKSTMMVLLLVLAACGANGKEANKSKAGQAQRETLGLFGIGEVVDGTAAFSSSDCGSSQAPDFSDCTAKDAQGRAYVFFDGVLARVSAKKGEVASKEVLLAGIRFGEHIDISAQKVEAKLGLELQWVESGDRWGYSSGYSKRSSAGVFYSLDLVADDEKKLIEVIESADY